MKKYLLTILFILAAFIPHFAHADITTGLVAWWKFDEGSGTTAADSTGNGHTSTLNGVAGWTSASKIGPFAVTYISTGSGNGTSFSAITTGTTFTYAAWINNTIGSSGAFQNLFAQAGSAGFWERFGVVNWFGVGTSNTVMSANTWYHVAVVDNGGSTTFYLNGVVDGTAATGPSFNANGMGCDSGTGGECFGGTHDDVRLYSRALSQADITELYNYPPLNVSLSRIISQVRVFLNGQMFIN